MNFNNPYSREAYKEFFQNHFLTDDFKISGEKLSFEFKPQYLKNAFVIGEDKSLELKVLEVLHDSENDPRVGLSKDIFRLMSSYGYKRALVLLHSSKSKNYRLSLATIELSLEGSKVKKEYSNPRRYSFFLGPDAKVKTPYNFLISKGRVRDFEDLLSRFSVEVVTKQFYQEIANWYFWALKNVKFPDDAEAEDNGRNIATIRLITRLIFIWFMKVRKLVPDELFDEDSLKSILKKFDLKNENYYKAILQNLFFATLNTNQADRRFTSKKKGYRGYSTDFGNHNVYRYEEEFFDCEEVIEKYFLPIPFLNGGLFECLDYKSKVKDERKYIDGFTSTKSQQPVVPNYLFFADDDSTDLNKDYGTTNKKYTVRGLIKTLSLYNFTIDENDPNDADVALDPELLGKVFENLLASYNPETAKTARKSTGSYYTPRPIVDYMVDESLKQYFKTHLGADRRKSNDSILAVGKGTGNIPGVGRGNNNTPVVGDIESKDALDTFTFFNPYDEIDIYRGDLPHWQQKDVWYFVTFRLADSLPTEIVEELRKERELWLIKHKKNNNEKYSIEELKEYYRLFSERVEKLLDDCRGSCVLQKENIAKIVADALHYFNHKKYILDDWVIMPNHVHILVKPINDYTLPKITHSWKSFTANEINKVLGRTGQLWLHESYDHIVRNERAFYAIKNYIRNNPIKANLNLPSSAQSWTYKSADSILAVGSNTNLPPVIESKDALDTLFSDEEGNPFDEATTVKLVSLIDSLRAVDPAVGSGAFPMRLLNRLVFLLHKLDPENQLWKKSQIDGIKKSVKDPILQRKFIEQIEKKFSEKNPNYGRKLYLIEKCIYGVDIQQIAVEIAKLRFFISLLVDEKTSPQTPLLGKERGWGEVENYGIEPLPNLDFKLMQGNSLISSIAGIDFNTKTDEKDNLFTFDDSYKKLIDEFEELKSQYQNEPEVEAKRKLKDEIDKKLIEIFEEKLNQHFPQLKEINEKAATIKNEAQRKEYIEKEKKNLFKKIGIDLDQAEKDLIAYTEGRKQKNFFLWDVYFAEVFTEKGGFDIVIGNPPYIKEYILRSAFDGLRNSPYYKGKMDIWYMFACQGLDLLKQQTGILAFIAQNNWVTSYGASIMRNKVIQDAQILKLLDFGNYMIFEGSDIQTMIMIFKKDKKIDNYQFDYRRLEGEDLDFNDVLDLLSLKLNLNAVYLKPIIRREKFLNKQLSFSENKIEDILSKIIQCKNFLLKENEVAQGIVPNPDVVTSKSFNKIPVTKRVKFNINIGDPVFVVPYNYFSKLNESEQNVLKPLYEPSDVSRYYIKSKTNKKIIYINKTTSVKELPNILLHLSKYKEIMEDRRENKNGLLKYYHLHWPRMEYFFENGEKILSVRKCNKPTFIYTSLEAYVMMSFNIIRTERINLKYLCSILNSSLIAFWLKHRGKMQGNNYQIDKEPLLALPLIDIPKDKQIPFITLVDKIIGVKQQNPQADTKHLEDQIDIMVYKLYELTYEEVKVIDPEIEKIISKEEYERFEIK